MPASSVIQLALIQKTHDIDAVQGREYTTQAAAMVGMQITIRTPAKLS
jgi:hypothetical protein